jgi:DNA gyrase/topoisomerase IV subunit B
VDPADVPTTSMIAKTAVTAGWVCTVPLVAGCMQPQFERQTATKLGNSETMTITNEAIYLSPTARRA